LIDTTYTSNIALGISKNFAMKACGACELTNLTSYFRDQTQRQNFLLAFLPLVDITYYCIVSTSQVREKTHNMVGLLEEIGMKEIDVRPNRLHGPNDMHMMVLDPYELNEEGIKKYLYKEKGHNIWLPLWFRDLDVDTKNKYFDEWTAAHAEDLRKREQAQQEALRRKRLEHIDAFSGMFRDYLDEKRHPGAYCRLSMDQLEAVDNLVKRYDLKVNA
jgi:hypothetical protein